MADIIDMPKLSDTMTEGTLVKWLKQEGDAVEAGDMLAEVETDKATMELESFSDGILLKILAKEGDQLAIGSPLCVVGEEGEDIPDVAAGGSADTEKPAEADKPSETKAETVPAETTEKTSTQSAPAAGTPTTSSGRIKASPVARKMAEAKGIDLNTVQGSGPGGRIVKADVESAKPGSAPAASSAGAPAAPLSFAGEAIAEDKEIPVQGMRGAIAKRLLESKTTIPHFYLQADMDAAPLGTMRQEINAKLAALPAEKGGMKITVNDLILKACADALRKVPGVNVAWHGSKIMQHGAVHLSFGVAIEDGLVTPVIRNAHLKSLQQISAEAKSLVGKARSKKLSPAEMSGSTLTVTNLGMFGIDSFYGIINPPNAVILSVAGVRNEPVVCPKTGAIVPGQRMRIGLSGDHRVVDGALAAEFLGALKSIIEAPASLLV